MTSRQLNLAFTAFKWVMCAIAVYVLSCVSCLAQFGVEQPMFQLASSATLSVQGLPGVANRWLWTDPSTNNFQLNNWTDRIAGVVITNDTGGAPVTNRFLGVQFTQGGGGLINDVTNTTTWLSTSNSTTLIMFYPLESTDFETLYMYTGGGVNFRVRRFTGGSWRAGPTTSEATCFADPALNKYYDMIVVRTNATSITIYTNGVVSAYNNVARTEHIMPTRLGIGIAANVGWGGYIPEVVFARTNWDALTISNAHYLMTNYYKHTP